MSVGLVWGSNSLPPAQQTGALPTELTSRPRPTFNSIDFEMLCIAEKLSTKKVSLETIT